MAKKSKKNIKRKSSAFNIQSKLKDAIHNHQNGNLDQARDSYKEILNLFPSNFEVLHLIGVVEAQSKNFQLAVDYITKAINIDGTNATFYNNRANAFKELNSLSEANTDYDKAIKLKPDYAEAFYNKGNVLQEMGEFNKAVNAYQKTISIFPNHLDSIINLGNSLRALKQYKDAKNYFNKALAIKPDYAEIYFNQGNLSKELGELNEALQYFNKAIELAPNYAQVYTNTGNVLTELRRFEEAIFLYDKAINIKPNYIKAYLNRGNTFEEGGKFKEAIETYQKVLSFEPENIEALFGLGNAYNQSNQLIKTIKSYKAVIDQDPNYDYIYGLFNASKAKCCDWENFEEEVSHIRMEVNKNKKVTHPFHCLRIIDDPAIQKKSAEIYSADNHPERTNNKSFKKSTHKKIRVGYFSADFNEHPLAYLTAQLFETHDKSEFEIFAFSLSSDNDEPIRKRIEKSFDEFIDISRFSDKEAVDLAIEKEIDIAIDLGGLTAGGRLNLFALRVAPIQMSYLGYLGTLGSSYMDYIVADKIIIPNHLQNEYTENIFYLPDYQCNDSKKEISSKKFTRVDLDLPEKGFIYCCFNQTIKITPSIFSSWMNILKAVEGSVLWLYATNEFDRKNLLKEAIKHKVHQERIIFGQKMPRAEYLARFRVADLFLDTSPYNAGTTASDALWAGLPILTFTGKTFAARVCSSVLTSAGLPELITDSQEAYEMMAIKLGRDEVKVKVIRGKIEKEIKHSSLYDIKKFTRCLESGYKKAYQMTQKDKVLEDIICQPS
tara:strand:- start:962 stop:3289 length:2328 start_codon:yes stop_codon:yes gene_type:complete